MGYPHIRGTVVAAEWQPSFIHLWPGIGCPDFLRPFEDTPPPSAIVNVLHREAVAQVAEQFGHERILYVLAITIRQKDWDARFSADNKQWAKTVPVSENPDAWGTDRNCYLAVNSHSGLVDLFTKLAREAARAHERKPSVLGKLKSRPPEAAAEAVKKAKEPSL